MINDMTSFNRQLQNAIVLLVNRHGGEIHGSWFQVADLIQDEVGGVVDDADSHRMKTHLMAVGFDHLTANSPVAFFRSMAGELNLVARELIDE